MLARYVDGKIGRFPPVSGRLSHRSDSLSEGEIVSGPLRLVFEARHLKKATTNFNISFEDALGETLLGLLAGDFSFSFMAGTSVHLKFRKEEDLDQGFVGTIEEAYLKNPAGEKHSGSGGLLQLFMCVEQEAYVREDENQAVQIFIIESDEQAEFAHRALVTLLNIDSAGAETPTWRHVLLRKELPSLGDSPQQAAQRGIEAGVLRYVLNIRPKTPPDFLPASGQPANAAGRPLAAC